MRPEAHGTPSVLHNSRVGGLWNPNRGSVCRHLGVPAKRLAMARASSGRPLSSTIFRLVINPNSVDCITGSQQGFALRDAGADILHAG
jgi:hypothetical protein